MQYNALIKNLKKSNLSFKKARGGWKNEIKNFLPQTGAEEELKFMIDINDFQPDKFCISNLAFSLIDDEHKKDPAFDEEKLRQAHKFTSEKELETLQKLHEEQQKNMELQRKEADNLALLITAVASALCKTLAKTTMAHIPLKIA